MEKIFGIDERQIRRILRQKSKVELSSANLTKFVVILQRILKTYGKERQKIVCDYIEDNFVQYDRLRHDLISNKVQINDGLLTARWRDITTTDINDII